MKPPFTVVNNKLFVLVQSTCIVEGPLPLSRRNKTLDCVLTMRRKHSQSTVLPTKSDSVVIFCLQLFSYTPFELMGIYRLLVY